MPHLRETAPILPVLDPPTAALVRLAAAIAGGPETAVREAFAATAAAQVPVVWEEEVILQSYLFAGFPRFAYTVGYLFAYSYLVFSAGVLAFSVESRMGFFGLRKLRIEGQSLGLAVGHPPNPGKENLS